VGSPLYFVLDDPLSSSRSRPGDVVHMHLRDPLLLNGSILAPAGTLATLTIVRTHHAASGDNDGSVQISLAPLALPKYGALPVRAINEYLTIDHTAGQLSTRDATDTVVDIFVPTYILWQALRKGHEYVLQPGTVFRALTAAAIDARDPQAIAIVGPQPLFTGGEAPHAAITESPFFTQAPMLPPPPKKGRRGAPTPSPSPSAAPSTTPGTPQPSLTAPPAVTLTPVPGVTPAFTAATPTPVSTGSH
jgi:hypothetical protein